MRRYSGELSMDRTAGRPREAVLYRQRAECFVHLVHSYMFLISMCGWAGPRRKS